MRRNDASKIRQEFQKNRKIKLDEVIAKETKEILGEKNVVESVEPFDGDPDSRANLIKKIKGETNTPFVPIAPWPTTEIVETPDEAIPYAVYLARKKPEDPEIIEIPVLEEEETGRDMAAIANVRRILREAQDVSDSVDEALEEYNEEYATEIEPEIESDIPEVEQAANIIEATVQKLTEYGGDHVPITELTILQDQVSALKKRFGEMNAVGWGQAGMSYGSGEVRLEFLDDVDRTTAKTNNYVLKYQSSSGKWIGAAESGGGSGNPVASGTVSGNNIVLTLTDSSTVTIDATTLKNVDYDPAGYEYTGDKTLATIVNEAGSVNGLEIEEDTWTIMPCTGAVGATPGSEDNMLPSTIFSSRIWDRSSNRFSFAEVPTDGVVLFRIQAWVYPETNNALLECRINFRAVGDGTDHVLNEDGDRIVLEDDSGNITGDYFQAYQFYQTVAGQEMNDGAGVEHERTFIFPIYVGNSSAQRGFGEFELNGSCDFTLYDSSVVAVLN
jgi:hypothetical protein